MVLVALMTTASAGLAGKQAGQPERDATGNITRADTVPAPRPENQRVMAFGNVSVISVARGWGTGWPSVGSHTIVTDFLIRPLANAASHVQVTTTGLGSVALWSKDPSANCGAQPSGPPRRVLTVGTLDRELRVCAAIPPRHFAPGQASMKGRFVVTSGVDRSVALDIELMSAPRHPFWVGVAWFFGLVTPAVVVGLVGFLVTVLTRPQLQRLEERLRFEKFKWENTQLVTQFFTDFYPVAATAAEAKFVLEVKDELTQKGILAAVPGPRRAELENAFNRKDRGDIVKQLKKLFPRYRRAI